MKNILLIVITIFTIQTAFSQSESSFGAGEWIKFRMSYSGFLKAGNATLSVSETRLNDKEVFHVAFPSSSVELKFLSCCHIWKGPYLMTYLRLKFHLNYWGLNSPSEKTLKNFFFKGMVAILISPLIVIL